MANFIPKKKQKKSRQELNDEARLQKQKRKHKGLPSGSRQSDDTQKRQSHATKAMDDPRIGSKKPIPLVADGQVSKPPRSKTPKAENIKLTPEQELQKLENDPRLETLLERLEKGHVLSEEEQKYVDRQLDRIEELMATLGLEFDDEDEDTDPAKDDIMSLLKNS